MNAPEGKFLSRKSYRQRRIIDAAKLLPILGIILFFLPLLWGNSPQEAGDKQYTITVTEVAVFIFCVWLFLIFLTFTLGIKLKGIENNVKQYDKSNQSEDSDV
ncbi:MAG: hypothetical protein OXC62_07820 [Aestuariivita sp.]|nr:hypothetical protein [Aestuariivita sp.]